MTDSPPVHAPGIALESRALVRVAGADWRPFLQGILTQDVESLKPGEARFGALLTPQGRLLHDLFIVGLDGGVLLDVSAAECEALIRRLVMYRLRSKVEIEGDTRTVVAYPSESFVENGGIIVADPRLAALGWRGYGDDAGSAPETEYDAHRLKLGVPGPADWGSDATYPIEANFDLLNGIDFSKGCFVGQETTSRMKRRGTIKNRMAPITFDGPPPAFGAEVLAGTLRAGEVKSGTGGRAIALLRLDRIEGADLTVEGRPAKVEWPGWMGL
jgi:folate-binding protein YgfZ